MDIVLVPPDNLRSVWAKIRDGLDAMPAEDWIPEDVYHSVKSGDSALYMGVDDDGYAGFMVLRKMVAEFSRQPYMHVWLAYSVGGKDIYTAAEGLIREVAKKAGATKITFGSPRLGWSKRYKVQSVNYAIPLQE